MKGISSQAVGASNNYKFNGGVELNESFDVDYYETSFRKYDCQTGRFTGVDELAEETFYLTPYQFGANDPVSYNDPTGLKFTTYDNNGSSATPRIDSWNARDAHIENALGDYTLSWVTMNSVIAAIAAGLSSTSGGGYVTADGNFVPYTQQQQAQVMNLMKTTNVRYHYANASGSALFEAPEYHGESSYTEGGWFFYTGTSNTTTFYNAIGGNAAVGFKDKSSWLDNLQTALDVGGIADPFGVADGLNTLIYLCRGDWKNAGISALGIIPYIGDVGKSARLGSKALKVAEEIRIASSAGGKTLPMTIEKILPQGSKIDDILNDIKGMTWTTGNEHAVVRLTNGQKAIVSGGPGGISFKQGEISTLFGHSHPIPAPPSSADYESLIKLGQSKQYILEGGQLYPIYRR